MKTHGLARLAGLLITLALPSVSWAAEPQRGVTETEIIIGTATERWGRIDGVVAVAGILRERMLAETRKRA